MSGIVGLWHLDDTPIEARDTPFPAMMAALGHRGADAHETFTSGSTAFGCHQQWNTPEEVGERQPLVGRTGAVLVMDGRVDNRQELVGRLGLTNDVSDASSVLAAYHTWGERFAERLQGSFSLALYDPRERRLLLARDGVGLRPLYYWTNGRLALFASEIKAILAHPEVAAVPNDDLIADCLLLDHLPYEDDGATFFAGVWRVLPGHLVSLDRSQTKCTRYWDFDATTQTRYRAYGDYAERLRELLIEAVRRIMRSAYPVVVSVSGGLDSACLLCIADDLRRNGECAVQLSAISYTSPADPANEENQFIALLESQRGLHVERVAARPGGFDDIPAIVWHAETPWPDPQWGAEEGLLSSVRERNARVLLSGLWSDQSQFTIGYLVDLFARLSWREVVAHLREYPKWFPDADPAYFRSRFYRELLLNLTPGPVRAWLHSSATWKLRQDRSWAGRDLGRRIRRTRPATRHPRYASAHARNLYQLVHRSSHRLQIEADEKVAARFGVERTLPFLDRDVVSYLMSIPGEIQTRNGVPRALLRDAMRGIVPDPILERRWRDIADPSDPVTGDSMERAGLESWRRQFFSDKLGGLSEEQAAPA